MRVACDELEADLQDLGIWLGDLWTGRLSVRRAAVLASQLPAGARVWQADMSDLAWSDTDYWSAALLDSLRENTWVTGNHGVPERQQGARPKPMDRPADVRAQREQQAKVEAMAMKFRSAWARNRTQIGVEDGA